MKCPYCDKVLEIPEVAFRNIETYGSGYCNIKCTRCKKVVKVFGKQSVSFSNPVKTCDESDW